MPDSLEIMSFRDIPLTDPFFDSLKRDYYEFPQWFAKKAAEEAYVQYSDGKIIGFMYPKPEVGRVKDVTPHLSKGLHVKIGSLKVEAAGIKFGEVLIKKALDHAIACAADDVYITIFSRHGPLIDLLQQFGFKERGFKTTDNGAETVLLKRLNPPPISGDVRKDYPLVNTRSGRYYLLSVPPECHSALFADSILTADSYDPLSDLSQTNCITKTHISGTEHVRSLAAGDKLVIYRTPDRQGPAECRPAVTSICVVEESRAKRSFGTQREYVRYAQPRSVLSEADLKSWWHKPSMRVIKMLYNAALTRKLDRKTLAAEIGLDRRANWGFVPLSRNQFLRICALGGVNGRLIVR